MNWKNVVTGSALVLAAQTGIASKTLSYPVNVSFPDAAGMVMQDTRKKIENSLRITNPTITASVNV